MAQISRLRDSEISNGNLINADDIDAELNQLVNESNSQDTRLTAIESSNITLAGVKTFSSAPKTDQIDERTADAGVTVDGVLHKDGAVKPSVSADPSSPSNGMIWYNSTDYLLKARLNGNTRTIAIKEELPFPKGYIQGKPPYYNAAASIIIPAGLKARNSTNTADIEVSGDITLSLASSGAAGLDTGSEASNTWYYVYLIKKSSDDTVSAVFSTTNESVSGSITLPSGYDLKRQLPLAVRNDSSSNIIPFAVMGGWPQRPYIQYRTNFYRTQSIGTDETQVLTSGTQTSFTAVSTASYVPPISRACRVFGKGVVSGSWWALRQTGSGLSAGIQQSQGANQGQMMVDVETDTSQQIDYLVQSGVGQALTASIMGFYVTEVN